MPLRSPSDDRARYVSQIVHDTEKNMAELKKVLSGYLKYQARLRDKSLKIALVLKAYANSETPAVKDALSGMAEHIQEVQKHRKLMEDRIEVRAREPLGAYRHMSKSVKAELKVRESAVKKEQQKKAQLDSTAIKDAGNRSKISQHQLELSGAAHEMTHSNLSLMDTVEKFELQKISDIKVCLNEFIHSEMQYHCKGLEVLTAAKKHLNSVDMNLDVQYIKDHLKLQPVA